MTRDAIPWTPEGAPANYDPYANMMQANVPFGGTAHLVLQHGGAGGQQARAGNGAGPPGRPPPPQQQHPGQYSQWQQHHAPPMQQGMPPGACAFVCVLAFVIFVCMRVMLCIA